MQNSTLLLYGSYGYTGRLIAQRAKTLGISLILAGRSEQALRAQSEETGFPYRCFGLDDTADLTATLKEVVAVIHCAGPFQYTARTMALACMEASCHYLDITGEYAVFEDLASLDAEARNKGVMLMPGVGFDVVPSDCLALHLKNRLPDAQKLELAFMGLNGGISRGTAKTMVENLGDGTTIRENGLLVKKKSGYKIKTIDFGPQKNLAACISWGDIATAWRSTGIPTIEVFMGITPTMARQIRMSDYLGWLLRWRPVKNFLKAQIEKRPAGPSDRRRAGAKSYLTGKVTNAAGEERISQLTTPDGYTLTAATALLIVQKIISGKFVTGYSTPAMAYGPDLILEIENTQRIDL
jgi:short subunit dehydrogenase-like uncharacterized protein